MKINNEGRKLIESFEGLILQSYDDANDKVIHEGETAHGTLTIGYGHTSAAGSPKVFPGMRISAVQADQILANDLSKVETTVNRLVKVPVTSNQYSALGSFEFNTGSLGRSSVLFKLNNKDYKGACDAFMLYTKGRINGQLVHMDGLTRRRKAEQALFNKKDNVSGPIAGTITGSIVAASSFSSIVHQHPYSALAIGIGLAIGVGLIVHYFKNKGK